MDRNEAARADNDRQDKIAEKHAPKIERAIREAMEAVARGLPTGGRADPPLDHFPRIEAALQALYRDMTRDQAESMVDRFKSGFQWLETKAQEDGFYERLYEEYLARYGARKIGQISETTRRQIVAIIERGLKEGLSVDEIADDILSQAPIVAETRAAIIARTETHSASMYASLASARRSTLPLNKEWVSVEDGRTRDFGEGDGVVDEFSHRIMDGVTVPMDDPFEVPHRGGFTEKLMFPGDPAGSAANVINCRCSQVYVTDDDEEDEDTTNPVQADPGAQFLFQTMSKPTASTAALDDFMTTQGIAQRSDLKGINASTISDNALRFLELKERFGLDAMAAIGPASRFLRRGGRIKALAAVYTDVTDRRTGSKGIFHMPTKFGTRSVWEKEIRNSARAVETGRYEGQRTSALSKPHISDEVKMRAARMDQEGAKWAFVVEGDMTAEDTVEGRIRAVIDHEFGHVVHLSNTGTPQMGEDINQFLRTHRPTSTGWNYLVSKYSGRNSAEYVAETFSLYMRGDADQYYRIHPELLAIYQRYDKLSGSKSVRVLLSGVIDVKQNDPGPADDISSLIREVMAAAPEDRARVRRELLAAYPYDDKDTVEAWLDEALALEVVDTI